jgi:hypothetical protein
MRRVPDHPALGTKKKPATENKPDGLKVLCKCRLNMPRDAQEFNSEIGLLERSNAGAYGFTVLREKHDKPCGAKHGKPCGVKHFSRGANGFATAPKVQMATWFRLDEIHFGQDFQAFADKLDALTADPAAFIVRAEPLLTANRERSRRLLHPKPDQNVAATLQARDRAWLLLDFDRMACPPSIDALSEPHRAAEYLAGLLPAELRGASYWWGSSGSFGTEALRGTGPAGSTLKFHLGFLLDRPVDDKELSNWAKWVNCGAHLPENEQAAFRALTDGCLLDPAVMRPIEPNFVAAPIFSDGLQDPVQQRYGRRLGAFDLVPLRLPPPDEPSPTGSISPWRGGAAGSGFEECLAGIGELRGFHEPITQAVFAAVRDNGITNAAEFPQKALDRLRTVVRQSDCHGRAPDYIEGQISEETLRASIEGAVERYREGYRAPLDFSVIPEAEVFRFERPTKTIGEVSLDMQIAIDDAISTLLVADTAKEPPQIGILSDMGSGKTRAVIESFHHKITANPELRVVHFVPGHAQADELAERYAQLFASETVSVWKGPDQPDRKGMHTPAGASQQNMCHLSSTRKGLTEAGIRPSLLCEDTETAEWLDPLTHTMESETRKRFCPHHWTCGYQRQLRNARQGAVRVWIIPHAMLTLPRSTALPAFDFAVIDESPFAGFVKGCDPAGREEIRTKDLTAVMGMLDGIPLQDGEDAVVVEGARAALDIAFDFLGTKGRLKKPKGFSPTPEQFRLAADLVDRLRVGRADGVRPGMDECELAGLKPVATRNRQVSAVSRLLRRLADSWSPSDPEGASSPYLVGFSERGANGLRMTWREPIHSDWLSKPILLLDGTLSPEIARQWLPRLEVRDCGRAASPASVHVRQVSDSSVAYGKLCPGSGAGRSKDLTTQRNNCARIALFLVRKTYEHAGKGLDGVDVCAIMPKAAETEVREYLAKSTAEGPGLLSSGRLALQHFNNIRGVTAYERVPYLVVVSRPEPSPATVEELAWTVFGKVGPSLGDKSGYPLFPAERLMGAGAPVRFSRTGHPDPFAEMVRASICDVELVQCIARARASRRTDRTPLRIDILTNVGLPVVVDDLVTWSDLLDEGDAVAMLILRGFGPSNGWAGVMEALPEFFPTVDAAKMWFKRAAQSIPPQK